MGQVVAISGIRELGVAWYPTVELAVLGEVPGAREFRVGGALGSDTVALAALCGVDVPRVAYVPFGVRDQPGAARRVIEACATGVVELRLPRSKRAYLDRNVRMLEGADRLVAFTDGRTTGGTAFTIETAQRMGLDVAVVVVGTGVASNPELVGLPSPTFVMSPYVTARGGLLDPTSEVIRRLKAGKATAAEIRQVADAVAAFIARTPELAAADAVVPVPRRVPGQPQDLLPLARAIGERAGLRVVRGLSRVDEPKGGVARLYRVRHTADEHAKSMRATLPRTVRRPIILDNVVTTGGTMAGSLQAVLRDTQARPVGLGVLFSEQGGLRLAA